MKILHTIFVYSWATACALTACSPVVMVFSVLTGFTHASLVCVVLMGLATIAVSVGVLALLLMISDGRLK